MTNTYERLTNRERNATEFSKRQAKALSMFTSPDPFTALQKEIVRPAVKDAERALSSFPVALIKEDSWQDAFSQKNVLIDTLYALKHSIELLNGAFNPVAKWTARTPNPETGVRETYTANKIQPYVLSEFYLIAEASLQIVIAWHENIYGAVNAMALNEKANEAFLSRELPLQSKRSELINSLKAKLDFIHA